MEYIKIPLFTLDKSKYDVDMLRDALTKCSEEHKQNKRLFCGESKDALDSEIAVKGYKRALQVNTGGVTNVSKSIDIEETETSFNVSGEMHLTGLGLSLVGSYEPVFAPRMLTGSNETRIITFDLVGIKC